MHLTGTAGIELSAVTSVDTSIRAVIPPIACLSGARSGVITSTGPHAQDVPLGGFVRALRRAAITAAAATHTAAASKAFQFAGRGARSDEVNKSEGRGERGEVEASDATAF